jgi:hypothetical protein
MSHADVIEWPVAVGRSFVAVMLASLLLMLFAVAAVWIDPDARPAAWWVTLVTLVTLGAVAAILYPTRYTLTPTALVVRAGFLRLRVPWEEIDGLDLRTSLLSSMTAGWTFERVGIARRQGFPLELGPADRIGFVVEVLARAPQLQPDAKNPKGSWVAAPRRGRP